MGVGDSRHQALEDVATAADVDISELEITRDSHGTVTELTVKYCESMKELPLSIGNLEDLELLELRSCENLTCLPKQIGNLKNLKHLKFSYNYSMESLPPEIGDLENLERLELIFCNNMTSLPKEIGNLKKLKWLNLSGCKSFQRLPPAICSFKDLTSLILRDCESLHSLPLSLCHLPRFENLDLYGCKSLPRPLVEAKDPILFFRKAGLFLIDDPSEIMTRIRGNKDLLFAAVQYPECASGFAGVWKDNPELANLRDDLGRNANDLACTECRQALLFYGRYKLEPRFKYKSKTCIVFFAKDLAVPDGSSATSVALKFMYEKAHFDKERNARCLDEENKRFSSDYVIDALAYHDGDTDSAFAEAAQEQDLPKYCMALEQGERNLLEAIGAEDLICDIDQVRPILKQLAHCLKHLHDKGFVHGDFKPKNAIREADNRRWQLIDFDAATRIAAPMGLKVSTAYIPPEMVAMDEGKPHLLAVCNVNIDADKVLKADPSFDVWSFGILMYRLLTGINFLEGVNDHDSINEQNLRKLALWNNDETQKTLDNLKNSSLARNLLRKIMRTNPTERPAFSDILEDPFFCPDSILNVKLDRLDRLVVFQSGPLAVKLLDGSLRRIPLLDFKGERHLLQKALADAKHVNSEIETVFETATIGGLEAVFETRMGRVIHLSGHSNDTSFLLEHESALGSSLTIEDVGRWKGKLNHLKLVFISACHSENIGRAFANVAEAPHVIHVICIRGQVDAKAVEIFTYYVYRALACGRSLKDAFGIARKAVARSQQVIDPSMRGTNEYRRQQAKGFVLLPERTHDRTYHDVRVFFDDEEPLPRSEFPTSIVPSFLPTLPDYYVYRELLMYEIIEALSTADVVRVNGIIGIGKTCTVSMLCGYMLKRPRSYKIDSLLWLTISDDPGSLGGNQVDLLQKTKDLLRSPSDELYEEVIKSLAGMKSVYMVFDSRGTSQEEKITFNDYFIDKLLKKDKVLDKIIIICDEDSDLNSDVLQKAVQVKVGRLDFEQAMILFALHIPDDLKSRPPLRSPTEFEEYLAQFNGEPLEKFWNSFWENEEFWGNERPEGIPQDIIELARNKAKQFLTGF